MDMWVDTPEYHVRLGDRGVRGEEGEDGFGVGGGDGVEEGAGVEGAGVEEVGGFYRKGGISFLELDG